MLPVATVGVPFTRRLASMLRLRTPSIEIEHVRGKLGGPAVGLWRPLPCDAPYDRAVVGRIANGLHTPTRQHDETLVTLDAVGGVVEDISSSESEPSARPAHDADPGESHRAIQELQGE